VTGGKNRALASVEGPKFHGIEKRETTDHENGGRKRVQSTLERKKTGDLYRKKYKSGLEKEETSPRTDPGGDRVAQKGLRAWNRPKAGGRGTRTTE